MRRKGAAVSVAVIALTLGTTIPAWAAGWVESNGQWQYQDDSGYAVTDEWKKGADGQWRYLDGSGYMAVDSWVDDEYYVDQNGIMVTGNWLQVNDPYSDQEVSWYYFNTNGKKTRDGWKKIGNKWYYFDEDGLMKTGWVDENQYYTMDNGEMVTGWQQLLPPEGADYTDEDNDTGPFMVEDSEGRYWYYFRSNGKKVTPKDDGAENGVVKIDNATYCMNSDGAIQFGWKNVGGGSSITDYKYFLTNGKMVTGWYSAEPPKSLSQADGEVHWYYFNSKGVPKADEDGNPDSKDMQTINKKTYLFNEFGNPTYGLRKVARSGSSDSFDAYYFGRNENECWAHTGKQQVEEEDGNTSTFFFNTSGKGYSGVKDNYLYYMGKLQKAADDKYEVIYVPSLKYGVMVNTSGKVMKNSTVKLTDGSKYKTNGTGQVTAIDGESAKVEGRMPDEPEWTRD